MEVLRKATFGLLVIMVMVVLGYFLLPLVVNSGPNPDARVLSSNTEASAPAASDAQSGDSATSAASGGNGQGASVDSDSVVPVPTDPPGGNRAQRRENSAAPTTASTSSTTVRTIGQATSSTSTRYLVTTSAGPAATVPAPTTTVPGASEPAVAQVEPLPAERVDARLAEVLVKETFPIQVDVRIVGRRPSDCHRLAWNGPRFLPDSRISLEITSTGAQRRECGQSNVEFSRIVSIGELDRGSYILELNGTPFAFTI